MNTPSRRLAAGLRAAGLLAAGLTAGLVLLGPSPAQASPSLPPNPRPPAGIGNGQVIVLRPHRADLVRNQVVVRVVALASGPISLDTLVRVIGDDRWASLSNGDVTLKAGLLQRPSTELRVGPAVHRLVMVDSADSPAYLAGTSSKVVFNGVTVVSSSGSGPAAESEHRPYVRYTHSSTVTANATTFQALGGRSAAGHHGVTVGTESTVTATDTTFRDSGRGLDIFRAARVSLTRVTASGNAGPGIVINRARNTSLGDVSASGNASGLLLRGPLPGLAIVGTVNANHNRAAGVDVVNLGTTPVGPFHTDHNETGLLVRDCPGCVLVGLTSTADRRGVTVEQQSTGAVVRDGSVTEAGETGIVVVAAKAELAHMDVGVVDGATGVRLAGSATGTKFNGGAVSGGRLGVSVRATQVAITGVSVTGSSVGFRISSRADGAVLRQISAKQTGTGLVTQAGPTTVTVSGLRVQQNGGQGVRSYAATLNLDGARISGATIGLNLHGHATVTNSTVADAAEAVRAGANSQVELTNDVLGAHVLGLRVAQSANVTVTDSTVNAPLGARGNVRLTGNTQFPALPLSWLGVFALAALTVAIVLELSRRLRESRNDRHVRAPAHVTNTA
ncbi:MAG: hypothetical protein QOE61_2619 [Micromonosporaceae bacterium]|nr:hypothetical protein [Micromonosporaceae bacterium]